MKGIHDPHDSPTVPPREPEEDITHWMERIARKNGWPVPEYKEPGADG